VLLKGLDFDGLLFTFLDIAQQCMAHFEKRRGDVPMTLRVSRVMLLVASYHGLNQRELAELADFDPATFVGVLDRLESEGWIQRINGTEYHNYHFLFLFRNGKIAEVREYNDTAYDAEVFGNSTN